MNPLTLSGVLPPVATPFLNDEVALDALKRNLKKYNQTGLSGYLVLGSNGEGVYLDEKEKQRVLEAAREAIPEDMIFMAGTGQESTRATIRLTNQAAESGADCALVVTPNFYKGGMTREALKRHYLTVADSARLPILIYNVPQFTGINLAPELIEVLAPHPNIAGIKDSSGNIGQLAEIIRATPHGFAVFVGNAPVFFPALCIGAAGGILAVANIIPEVCVEIKKQYDAGNLEKTRQLQADMTPLARWVTSGHGIGGLKTAMKEMGYDGGLPRMPLLPPKNHDLQSLRELLQPFRS